MRQYRGCGWVREPANGLTHLAGVHLTLLALGVLMAIGIGTGALRALIGLVGFGVTQIARSTASTLHHSLRLTPRSHRRLLTFDRAMIVVFIAGTYIPVCLIAPSGDWRWGCWNAVLTADKGTSGIAAIDDGYGTHL